MARKTVYNRITSEEILEKVNPKNIELLKDFEEYLNSTDKSVGTISNYRSDIQICWCWNVLYNNNKFFIDFTKRDIIKYQNYLINDLSLGSGRIRRLKSSLSSLSKFIETILDEDYPNFKPIINKIPAPTKMAVREKTILDDKQIDDLLKYLVDNKDYQQACLFALVVASGARKAELLRFKTEYFKDENIMWGSFYKTPEKITTKGRGRKGKLLYKYSMVSILKPYLDLWLKEREKIGINSEWLFVKKQNNNYVQLQVSTINSWTRSWSEFLGVDFYIHCVRHYWTTKLSEQNLPASVIKQLQGWESLEMVNLYVDTDADEEIGKYFNDGKIVNTEGKQLSDM